MKFHFLAKDGNDEAVAIGVVEDAQASNSEDVAIIIEDKPGLKCSTLTEGQFGTYQAFKSLPTLAHMALTPSRISENKEVHIFSFQKGGIVED